MTEQDYIDFALALSEIQSKIAKPDLMKVGKNFRCISESAILDVINPVLNSRSIDYNIEVLEHELQIKEAAGPKFGDKKLVFVASCKVRLTFTSAGEEVAFSEALGMGIDDGDKAMGKAYTYAVKYALLKKFRLQYADDPDAEPSKEILLPEEPISSKTLNKLKPSYMTEEEWRLKTINAKYTYLPYGSMIPAYSRCDLIETALKISPDGSKIVYFDTDSIFFIKDKETMANFHKYVKLGDFLGEWKVDKEIARMQATAPKRYKYEDAKSHETKVKAGGINFTK